MERLRGQQPRSCSAQPKDVARCARKRWHSQIDHAAPDVFTKLTLKSTDMHCSLGWKTCATCRWLKLSPVCKMRCKWLHGIIGDKGIRVSCLICARQTRTEPFCEFTLASVKSLQQACFNRHQASHAHTTAVATVLGVK